MDDYADEEDDDDDDDDEPSFGDHVRFEDESIPKRRRRKSSSVSYRPRSNSSKSLELVFVAMSFTSCKPQGITLPGIVIAGVFPPSKTVTTARRMRPLLDRVPTVSASRRWDASLIDL